jgi:glycosyltransferase involved in cell wall biosynthesis
MQKALLITFYFPPCGSSATARKYGLARQLKDLGVDTTVISAREEVVTSMPGTRKDDSYTDHIKDINIIRTRTYIPIWFLKILYKLKLSRFIRLFFPFEPHIFWILPAYFSASKIIKKNRPDFILSSSFPNSTHLVAMLLNRKFKIPWIADFADPISYKIGPIWFTKLQYYLMVIIEKTICKKANGICTQSNGTRDVLLDKYNFIDNKKIMALFNAYDEEFFKEKKSKGNEKFTILHSGEFYLDQPSKKTGSFIKKLFSRIFELFEYRPYKADFYPHSMEPLLNALSIFSTTHPELKDKIQLIHNGYVHPYNEYLIDSMGLSQMIVKTGLVSYKESIEYMQKADLLYLPLFHDLDRERNFCIPGKLFSYMATEKPILSPIQPGDTRDILERSGLGLCHHPINTELMAKQLYNFTIEFLRGDISVNADKRYIKMFSRSETIKDLLYFTNDIVENFKDDRSH